MSQIFLSHVFLVPHVVDSAKLNKLPKGKFVRRFLIGNTLISMRRLDDKTQVPAGCFYSSSGESASSASNLSSSVSTTHLSPLLPWQQTPRFPKTLLLAVVLQLAFFYKLYIITAKSRNAAKDLHQNVETHTQDNMENTKMLRDDDMENMRKELRRTREELSSINYIKQIVLIVCLAIYVYFR
jgi:hypothetical protein